jgi:hypothetical protein
MVSEQDVDKEGIYSLQSSYSQCTVTEINKRVTGEFVEPWYLGLLFQGHHH